MRVFVFGLICAAAILPFKSLAADYGYTPEGFSRGKIKMSMMSCDDYDDWIKFVTLAGDPVAATRFAKGRCHVVAAGSPIIVMDLAIMSQSLCVRPDGSPKCFWTTREAVDY